ncbi:MAG: hypothetical protein HY328_09135 [Chloroflexi bacterium]|nr:hypothetical protein [Chloroflexota bacterium]
MQNQISPSPAHLSWTETGGWPGGTVTALALLPGSDELPTILAGTKAGIFHSEDGGRSWQTLAHGPADPAIVALALSPDAQGGRDIFVTTEGGRLYRSSDGGATWPEIASWAGLGVGVDVAISPAYAADATLFVATADGPLRSQDRGESWESSTFGLLDVDTLCIACSPDYASSETLWAGTAFGGFFRSRNSGRSWREAGAGLPDAAVQCLAQAADGTLYAGTESDGVYRSTDGGSSWQRAGQTLARHSVNSLAALPGCLLAGSGLGLFRSEDGGEVWQPCAGGDFVAFVLAGGDGLAVAGAWQSGVHTSTDGGRCWQTAVGSGADLLTGHAPPLAVLTPWNELFVVDGDGAAALSTDRGARWQPLDFLPADSFCALITGAGSGDTFTLFVCADDAIYRRIGQDAWQQMETPGNGVTQLVASAAFGTDGCLLLADKDGYLYLSEDRGASWQELSPPDTEGELLAVALSPYFAEDRRLYLVTAGFEGQAVHSEVWQSDDAGRSWTDLAGLTLDSPALCLLPLADELRRPLLLAGQNRLISLYTDPETGDLAVDQRFLEADVRIVALMIPNGYTNSDMLLAATNRGIWQVRSGLHEAECIGLAEKTVVTIFPAADGLCALTLGGEIWWGDSNFSPGTRDV